MTEARLSRRQKTVITVISKIAERQSLPSACLVVIYGAELGRRFLLDRPEMTVGRSSQCEIVLDQDSVSRQHAKITVGPQKTAVKDLGSTNGSYVNDELVTEIYVPSSPLAAHSTYLKFKERESLDFAMASAAVALQLDGKTIKDARIVLGGVAPKPWRVPAAEKFVIGKTLTKEVMAEAAKIALADAEPLEKNAYKVPLAQTLVRRALAKAGGVEA